MTAPALCVGVEVVLVESTHSYACGPSSPELAQGTRAKVDSWHWDGGILRVCIVTIEVDEHGYRRFAIVQAGQLALTSTADIGELGATADA